MILLEGMVLLPPERGTILGRALWKVGLDELRLCHVWNSSDVLFSLDMSYWAPNRC